MQTVVLSWSRLYSAILPLALRDKVTEELQILEDIGVLERVQHSEWVAPMVLVVKSDGTGMRICGDFGSRLNPVSKVDTCPMPRVEDLYSRGGCTFSKIDLSNAYLQVILDEDSRKYTAHLAYLVDKSGRKTSPENILQ